MKIRQSDGSVIEIRSTSFEDISNSIIEGMKQTKQEMMEKGLWHDKMTLEEWSNYAGQHVKLTFDEDGA